VPVVHLRGERQIAAFLASLSLPVPA